jgi:hypothetical protein
MAQIECPACGGVISDADETCSYCQANVQEELAAAEQQDREAEQRRIYGAGYQPGQPTTSSGTASSSSGGNKNSVGIGAYIGAGVILLVGYLLFQACTGSTNADIEKAWNAAAPSTQEQWCAAYRGDNPEGAGRGLSAWGKNAVGVEFTVSQARTFLNNTCPVPLN